MDHVRGDDVIFPRRQHHVIASIVDAQVDVWAGQHIVIDRVEKPGRANDRPRQLDDVDLNAVVDADRAGGCSAAQADHERITRVGMQRHRQVADPPMAVHHRAACARLMIAVQRQRELARARKVRDDGRLDALFAPDDPLARIALGHELIEGIGRPRDGNAENDAGSHADQRARRPPHVRRREQHQAESERHAAEQELFHGGGLLDG